MPTPKTKQNLSCITCKLRNGDVKSPKMEAYGEGRKGIMILGEAPGAVEDRKGMPWQGRTGRLLKHTLAKFGIDLFEDCICVNAVNCRPPDNRTPKALEIDCCREVIVRHVYRSFRPHIIVPLGTVALQSFLSPRWPTNLGGISQWHGFVIPDQELQAWVLPTFHPSYITRIDSREANTVWEKDLGMIRELEDVAVPTEDSPNIKILEDDLTALYDIRDGSEVAVDFETTGLKAQRSGHRIICAAIAPNDTDVYAFMIPKTKAGREPFLNLLTNPRIGKMAHNMKYETSWAYHRWGIEVQNWQWDSMLAAHMLDNRSGVTGLKFQTYANFGTIIKEEDVAEYIYRKDPSGNGFNKVFELLEQPDGPEKLLRHVALDAHYQYRLAKRQMIDLDYQYLPF